MRHGRRERRLVWALADPDEAAFVGSRGIHGTPWPHLRQLVRVERQRLTVRRGRVLGTEVECRYYVTSAGPDRADARRLGQVIRGHWGIENRVHYVRDVTFDEDRSRGRRGAVPEVLAACRNLVISLLRLLGVRNIAAALRTYASRPAAATHLLVTAGLS